jgi:type I restriction enzyme S subunit
VLRIPNIEPGKVNAGDLKYATLKPEEAARFALETGDLVFIRTNGVVERLGACAVYDDIPTGALFASYLIRARLKRDLVDPDFAAYFFASEVGTAAVVGRATPAADGKYNLNTGAIDSLPIPIPPTLDEQREVVDVLQTIDRKIAIHHEKRSRLNRLFTTVLHNIMTAELLVTDIDTTALSKAPAPRKPAA